MRAPELQNIDQLDKLKKSFENKGINELVSTLQLQFNASQPHQDIVSIQDLIIVTSQFVDILIEKTNSGEVITGKKVDNLVDLFLTTHPEKNVSPENVLVLFIACAINIPESVEKTCAHYGLTFPRNLTLTADTFSNLPLLNEVKYSLDLMKNELLAIHPIQEQPYWRHTQLSDSVVTQIQSSQLTLSANSIRAIEHAQSKLNEIMHTNNYPSETLTESENIASEQTRLIAVLKEEFDALNSETLVASNWININNRCTHIYNRITACQNLGLECCYVDHLFTERLNSIQKVIDELKVEMSELHIAAGVSVPYFSSINRELLSDDLDRRLVFLSNNCKLFFLCNKYTGMQKKVQLFLDDWLDSLQAPVPVPVSVPVPVPAREPSLIASFFSFFSTPSRPSPLQSREDEERATQTP